MPSVKAPAPSDCPLCGQPNQCAMETERTTGTPQPPCWCTRVDFSPALLGRIAPEARGLACICQACASAGKNATPLPDSN